MAMRPSRRAFFKGAAAAGLAPALAQAAPDILPPTAGRLFFSEPEAAFVRAAVDRLIPSDELGPGAVEAGVVDYIDRQLAGAYGAGARMYLEGPWFEGTPEQGYQLRFTPGEVYRLGLEAAMRAAAQRFGAQGFEQAPGADQDDFLKQLESGAVDLEPVPAPVLFETLLANTVEGYLSDPMYGGNRNMAGWRLIGFPGAYAQYVELVERHGEAFRRPPMSIAESALAHRAHAHR